jgi:NAD(P)-dependent dehydrogenase (short-subunit alcohol dehydrogenase family)
MASERVAVVTGASRGLGKGIAVGLGAAGWVMYVTGRSTGTPTEALGGMIEDTAVAVSEAGGEGVAVACDHRDDDQVAAVFDRVGAERTGLDLLVNNAFAFAPSFFSAALFWEHPLDEWDMVDVGLRSHYVAAVFAARVMAPAGRGVIVNTSSFSGRFGGGPVPYDIGKAGVERFNRASAPDLARAGITTVSLWPGLIRTERTISNFAADPGFLGASFTLEDTESREFTGRVIAALAADPDVARFNGRTVVGAELAAEVYGITDVDGRQPVSLRTVYGVGPE